MIRNNHSIFICAVLGVCRFYAVDKKVIDSAPPPDYNFLTASGTFTKTRTKFENVLKRIFIYNERQKAEINKKTKGVFFIMKHQINNNFSSVYWIDDETAEVFKESDKGFK